MNSKFDKRINDIYQTLIEIAPPADADKAVASLTKVGDQLDREYKGQGVFKKFAKRVTDPKKQSTRRKASELVDKHERIINRGVLPALGKRNNDLEDVVKSLEDETTK